MTVSPSATSPASTRAAPARTSKARTGAPERRVHPPDHGVVALGADVGPHPAQLLDVAEPTEEQVLGDDAHPLGHGEQGHQQRLVVGGEARDRAGWPRPPTGAGRSVPHGPQAVGLLGDADAGGRQLADEHVHVVGAAVLDDHLAAGQAGRHQEGGHHQPVGDDGVTGRVEGVDPLDLDAGGAAPRDPGPHGVEEVGQVASPRARGRRSR